MKKLLAFQAQRAREYYRRADAALPRPDARRLVAARIMGAIYRGILEPHRGRRLRRLQRASSASRGRAARFIAATTWAQTAITGR